ncbi:MAG: APC family permease [Actinobacteria bacterium]|nr:APC family permease [Actinomycetota bacterium]
MTAPTGAPGTSDSIGLWGAVAIGIGGMVGGGIFAVLGVVAAQAGGAAPLALLLAGVVALLTASSYALLSVEYPSRGGSVVFVDRVFGVGLATGALNNLLWFGYLVTLSLYAAAFANYAATFVTGDGAVPALLYHGLVTAAVLVPTALNLLSAAAVARAETAVVLIKLGILVVVGVAGAFTVDAARLATSTWPALPSIAAAGMLVFVAYEGFELIANAGEDIRNPRRNLPRALYLSVGIVVVLYVTIAAITVGTLTPSEIAGSSDFALAAAARPALGQLGFTLVASAAVLATLSAINATLYGAARLSYSIAAEGELPPTLERSVWSEPVGLLITAGATLVLANVLDVTAISSIASAVFLIVFGAVNLAAFSSSRGRALRRAAAGLGVLGCAGSLIALEADTVGTRPGAAVLLAVIVALSVAGEAWWLRSRRRIRVTASG